MHVMWSRALIALSAAVVMVSLPESGTAEPISEAQQGISEAEQRTFLDNHLANVTQSETLEYQFKRSGGVDAAFEDHVVMSVRMRGGSEAKSVDADYLSGDHHVNLPRIDDAHGNPVVMYFLEADVRDMNRRTGGAAGFFRKRIRLALAQAAEIHPVHFEFAGRDVAGTEIRIRPYHGDPLRARLKNFEEKLYVLTLSPQVPGGVYQLRTDAPASDAAAPALEDVLTFTGVGTVKPVAAEVQ